MPATDAAIPGESPPISVFVSYAHEDRARAQAVIRALEQAGFQVWWDGLIVAGAAYAIKTEQALDAASVVVVLWSRDSIVSHWVRDEAAVGRDRSRLVPVSLDGSEPPLGFRQYLFIDLSKWHGKADAAEIRAVVQAVEQAHGLAPAAAPAAATTGRGRTTRRRLLIAGGSLAAAAAIGAAGLLAWRRGLLGVGAIEANGVAVLPFKNLSGDPAQAYFADGLSAEVRGALARDHRLRVIAQVSSNAFRDGTAGAVDIARKLGIAYLLDGNVRRAGTTFRIAAELIDGRSGFSRWAQTFDRSIDDIFAVQSEIAGAVVSALTSEMQYSAGDRRDAPPAATLSGGTTNVAAFDAYLRGRAAFNLFEGEASERRALAEFDAAIAADPRFAAAHAARARTLIVIANWYADAAHTAELYDAALRAAETATGLAPDLADAQSTLGFVLAQGKLDFRAARQPYELSRQLGEGDATVMGRYALYCAHTGRASEAVPAMERALALDPLNPLVHRAMGSVLYEARRYAEAIPHIDRALTMNPKLSGAHAALGNALLALGRTREARDAYLEESKANVRLTGIAIAEHKLGNEAAARGAMDKLVTGLGDSVLYQQAQVRAQWGEREAAVSVLRRARQLGDSGLIYVRTDPLLDPLRQLPQFRELLTQLGFD
jgi:TolB-like protein/Tfp pilus assembly protein PilF